MTMLLVLAAIGYLVARGAGGGGGSGGGSSSYTEQHDGMRYFTAETKARLMTALEGWSLVPVANPVVPDSIPANSVALYELIRGSTSSVKADQAAAMASKQGKAVLLSATMGAAVDGLTQERQFMLFCVSAAKPTVASPVSPFAILLDAI